MKHIKNFCESKSYEEYYTYLLDIGFEEYELTQIPQWRNEMKVVKFAFRGDILSEEHKDEVDEFVDRIEEFEDIKILTWTFSNKKMIVGVSSNWFGCEIDPFMRGFLSNCVQIVPTLGHFGPEINYFNKMDRNEIFIQYISDDKSFYIDGRVWDYLSKKFVPYYLIYAIIETSIVKYLNWRIDLFEIHPRVVRKKKR